MGYNKRNTTIILIITIISVLGLSIAFAAFSSTLTVKSNATITPDSGEFKVVFSSKSDSLSTTGVGVSKTGNATAGTPTIDNTTNPTIKNLSASFTSPGEKIEYTFYARNEGSYDAYLSSVVFDNIKGKSVFKECIAGEGTSSSMVESACNGIKVTTTLLSTAYTSTTLNITNHVLKKNNSEVVKVTIEYTSGSAVADGPFTINFGKIYLTYGSTSLSGMPTIPTEPICTAVTEATSGNVPTGSFNYGDEYTCNVGDGENKTFFVLENSDDNVSLIMDRNIDSNGKGTTSGNTVAWSNDESNHKDEDVSAQAVTAKEYLKTSTTSWTKLTEAQISLPTGQQIATAGGDSAWTDSKRTGTVLSSWLYGNLNSSSAPYGHWTSTPIASDSSSAWYVGYGGTLGSNHVDRDGYIGVRPVITISKLGIQ